MKMRIDVVILHPDGSEHRKQVLTVERHKLAMETLGMSLAESKSLLEGVRDSMIASRSARTWSGGGRVSIAGGDIRPKTQERRP